MKVRRIISWLGVGAALLALVAFTIISTACGGGGRRKPPGTTPVTTPSTGAVEWVHTWNGSGDACALALDNDWNAHIAGSTWRFGAGDSDVSILKLTPYGNVLWGKTWGGADKEECYALASNGTGGIYVAGLTESFSVGGSYDLFLLNYGPNGNILWQKTWGGIGRDAAHALSVDYDGNIYAVGFTSSFGAGGRDALILKYSPDGSLLWAKTWGGSDWDCAWAVAIDNNGDIYTAGRTKGFEGCAPRMYGAFLLKYSSNGDLLWQRTWGWNYEDRAYALAIDSRGDIYMAGETRTYGAGLWDVFLLKFSSDGNALLQRTWGGSDWDIARDIAFGSDGTVFVVGETWSFSSRTHESSVFLLTYSNDGRLSSERIWNAGDDDYSRARALSLDYSDKLYICGQTRDIREGEWQSVEGMVSAPTGFVHTPQGHETTPDGVQATPEGVETELLGEIDASPDGYVVLIMKYDPS